MPCRVLTRTKSILALCTSMRYGIWFTAQKITHRAQLGMGWPRTQSPKYVFLAAFCVLVDLSEVRECSEVRRYSVEVLESNTC